MTPLFKRALWVGVFVSVALWSGIAPKDRIVWWLEATPALLAFVLLVATRDRFPLTPLLYVLILAHSVILLVGAHYTYAEVPLFDTLRDLLGSGRNNYDKLGHFAQGFVPALISREILLRFQVVRGRGWLAFLVVCVCLAISAFYELLEWWAALAGGESAEAFLSMQGYVWDTQSDMAWALSGACIALLLFSRLHDRQLATISPPGERP